MVRHGRRRAAEGMISRATVWLPSCPRCRSHQRSANRTLPMPIFSTPAKGQTQATRPISELFHKTYILPYVPFTSTQLGYFAITPAFSHTQGVALWRVFELRTSWKSWQ